MDKRHLRRSSRLALGSEPQYRVKWRGYDDTFNTWEPLSGLADCMDMVHAYEERVAESEGVRPRLQRRITEVRRES